MMYEYLIPASRKDEHAFALIRVGLKDVLTPDDLRSTIRRAMDRWVEETNEGKREFELAKNWPNIEDLNTMIVRAPTLKDYLRSEGIQGILVEIHSYEKTFTWRMDDILTTPKKFKNKKPYKRKKNE